jgi:bacillithiol system protein YtxJ
MLELKTEQDFLRALDNSITDNSNPIYIYKHSTRCPVSRWAWVDIKDKVPQLKDGTFFFLDVIACRPVSNLVAERLNVRHESPQLLKIQNGVCVEHVSHERVNTTFFD